MSATTTVTGLEQRLYERAEKKLNAALKQPLNPHVVGLTLAELDQVLNPYWKLEPILRVHDSTQVKEFLFDKHIGEYLKAETDLFLAEIDRLKSEVDNLNERFDEVIQ